MLKNVIPTGNAYISIPDISKDDASIHSVSFLHMGYRGLVEICGNREKEIPLLKPFLNINGQKCDVKPLNWERMNYWIPAFKAEYPQVRLEGMILAPVEERGFIYHLKAVNTSATQINVTLGLDGYWHDTYHSINESRQIAAEKQIYHSGWNENFICELVSTTAIFAFAPITEGNGYEAHYQVERNTAIFNLSRTVSLAPGESVSAEFYWGVCLDGVSAATSAKEMQRHGLEWEYKSTQKWLSDHSKCMGEARLDSLYNTNLFFNFFFASGIALDTEEFVLVTSRSPRYYVSAAYWDRDSLLWSFPSILLTDAEYAGKMLEYVFRKQLRNVGIHSRFIDGVLLEPGFELDELCAPVLALAQYVRFTGDMDFIKKDYVKNGIDRILALLLTKKHPQTELYETFLQPSDDVSRYPYLTYDNVLVWKMLICLSQLLPEIKGEDFCHSLTIRAEHIRSAIYENCIVTREGKRVFAWSVDLNGNAEIYDEPPGSLALLPYYGFCGSDCEIYVNTMEWIRRPNNIYSFAGENIPYTGCAHAPHPWVLSIANSLLCGEKVKFLTALPYLKMDNGIACESVDEASGESATGEAFATCAGFLAYALHHAFYEDKTADGFSKK